MGGLFSTLTNAVEATPLIAFGAALLWGILSVVLSPCHLAGIPLIVAFVSGQSGGTTRRAFGLSALFAVGIMLTIIAIGVITAASGRLLGDIGPYGNYIVAALLFFIGLHLLDVIPLNWAGPGQMGFKRKGMLAALVLGLLFGVALGPCTFAYMAPMLAVTFKLATTAFAYAMLLLLAFAVGHCSVIIVAGTSTGWVQRYLNWNERTRGAVILRRFCGALLLLGGIYLVYLTR